MRGWWHGHIHGGEFLKPPKTRGGIQWCGDKKAENWRRQEQNSRCKTTMHTIWDKIQCWLFKRLLIIAQWKLWHVLFINTYISNSTNFSQNPHGKICERSTFQSQHDWSPIQVCKYQMKKYELWGWYPNIQISIETIWVSKLNNKISGSLRNVQPMPLTICRRLTQASEPITALTSSIILLQHWSTFNSNNQWTRLRRHLLPADGNVRRRPTTVDRRPFPF